MPKRVDYEKKPDVTVTRSRAVGMRGNPGSKPQDLERKYDTSQLREGEYGKKIHRDYAAHFFRWGWAQRFVKYKTTRILDVGCGQDLPLIKILANLHASIPAAYVGVDLNRIRHKSEIGWVEAVYDQFDFPGGGWRQVRDKHERFDLVSCFEVIEHMHQDSGKKLLIGMRESMADDGVMLLSTPVYNGRKMAANHIHEYGIAELRELLESVGLVVEKRFGTFASWNDVKRVCTETEKKLLDEVAQFYGGNVLACFLAPKYPDASANNALVIRKAT